MFERIIGKKEKYSYESFSQEGEDMILKSFYEEQPHYKGFYVDVGAHHPIRFSNTYFFYKRGWKGINIDPTPDSMKAFNSIRKDDINLEIAVNNDPTPITFSCFNEPALNTFDQKLAKERDGLRNYKITQQIKITPQPLSKVLDEYLPEGEKIDFMTIDVEGLDYEVLQSNNWEKYSPTYILIEDHNTDLAKLNESKVYTFLVSKNYALSAKTKRTLFFKLKQ